LYSQIIVADARFVQSLQAMVTKSTFLSEPEWITIPYTSEPKRTIDLFLDVLLQGIPLLKDGDDLATFPPHLQFIKAVELLKRCWNFDNELQSFYENLKSWHSQPLFWPAISTDSVISNEHVDSLAPISLEFVDMRTAVTIMLYWAILTVLRSGMSRLYDSVAQLDTFLNPFSTIPNDDESAKAELFEKLGLPDPGYCRDFIVTARKVFQCVDFCMKDELGQRIIVAPLMMVVDSLKLYGKYEEEIKFAFEKIQVAQKRGMKIVKYIVDPKTRWWK
jgi:hypothetical protein